MARLFNGSSDYMVSSGTVNLSTVNKATVSFWLYYDAYLLDAAHTALEFGTLDTVDGGFLLQPDRADSNHWLVAVRGTSGLTIRKFTPPSAAAWHQFVFLLDPGTTGSNAVNAVYLDGVSQTLTDVGTASTSANFGNASLYVMRRPDGTGHSAGRMAELAIWGGVLLDANEAASLALGYRPARIRPASLHLNLPLLSKQSPEIELAQGNGFTVSGTSNTDHPRVLY